MTCAGGGEGNSDLTLKGLSVKFDACERRVEEQFQSLCQMIKNLSQRSNKYRDGDQINRVDGFNLSDLHTTR